MYLAPFIGIGLGWMLSLGIEGLFFFKPRKQTERAGNKVKGESNKGKEERGKAHTAAEDILTIPPFLPPFWPPPLLLQF